jgi:uncharacterized protein (DUF58 family)
MPEVNKVRLTVLIALMFSALCAGVFRTPPILFMAALLTSSPFVGLIVSRNASRRLRIERLLPETGTVGDTITGEIIVTNSSRWPSFLVHIRCGTSWHPQTGVSNDALLPVGGDEQVVPMLRGHMRAVWQQSWTLRRRGVHVIAPARTGVLDPLGLSSKLRVHTAPHTFTVLPRPVRIEQLGFWGGAGMENQIPKHSTVVADAMDFHGVRPWSAGEAIRRAHWKYTARTGQLHVIEWEETPAADMAILLDAHASGIAGNDAENTLEIAITVVASIAAYLLEIGCRLQCFYFAEEAAKTTSRTPQPPRLHLKSVTVRSVEGLEHVLRALAEVEPVESTLATAAHLAEAAQPQILRGLGTLLIASSETQLQDAVATSASSAGKIRTFLIDADSFATATKASETASDSTRQTALLSNARPAVARHRGAQRRREMMLRRGDGIAAALEGQW